MRLAMGLLLLSVVFRPEANGVLLIALAVQARRGRVHPWISSAWLAYHAARFAYFGGALPNSFLVKVLSSDGSIVGAAPAWIADLALAAIPLSLIAQTRNRSSRTLTLSLVPLAIHAASALSIGGDWMGWSRLLLPGVIASAAALAALPSDGSRPTANVLWAAALASCLVAANPGNGHLFGLRPLPRLHPLRDGLGTPLSEDVAFLAREAPWNASVVLTDVGMMSQVPGVRILDAFGLAWRRAALAAAGLDDNFGTDFVALVRDDRRRPALMRASRFDGQEPAALPSPISSYFREQEQIHYAGGIVIWYRGRTGTPTPGEVLNRWKVLARRFPSQPYLLWQLSMAQADDDRYTLALHTLRFLEGRFPGFGDGTALDASLDFPRAGIPAHYLAPRRVGLYWNSKARSRPLTRSEWEMHHLELDADDPGEAGAAARISTSSRCGSGPSVEVAVRAHLSVPLPRWPTCNPSRARVVVEFVNDKVTNETDRNLYVSLGGPTP